MPPNRRSKDGGGFDLPGYQVLDQLYESSETSVYQALRVKDRLPVILKVRTPKGATPIGLSRCRYEYEIIRRLDAPGIIKAYDLKPFKNTLVLILEDCGGESLSRLLCRFGRAGSPAFPIADFFVLADKCVQGLAGIHDAGVVHKDICPSNFVYNATSGELRIIDFDIATTLDRENPIFKNPRSLEGTLAYLSPEQTGRMNRSVDYRSDYYSLGVAFYELLTGKVPFEGVDAIEMVHHHMASTPNPPHLLNLAVPEPLSSLVLKLMAKAPEDRYQGAHGLRKDLETLSRNRLSREKQAAFEPGRYDRAERFIIPEKLYGRQREVEALLVAFEGAASGETRLVMVTGSSGIGKTAVINEIHKPIVRRRGYFVKGKFDQLGRGVPFSAITQAMRELVKQLLGETSTRLGRQKADILNALGDGAQGIIDVAPELELVVGPQSPMPALSGDAASNRFNLLFQKFIGAVATADHPLAVFLDDLQWADAASLALIQMLVGARRAGYLLIVGAYRDNEVTAAHPLRFLLAELTKAGASFDSIAMAPLPFDEVARLIADALGCSTTLALPLAALVRRKTQGNPFFTRQVLKLLHEEGLIVYDGEMGFWHCDIARVSSLALSGDVAAFMSRQLKKLPKTTREALELAACIGSSFDLGALAVIRQRSQMETAAHLWNALQAGLILPLSEAYRFLHGEGNDAARPFGAGSSSSSFIFLHDRVKQAAYALIPPGRRKATHLRIARLLFQNTPEAEREARIFEIANQFNRGFDLMLEPAERLELAGLDLRAGRKAKAATAYKAAWDYFTIARQVLPAGSWQSHYELTLSLHESSVEAAFLIGDFDEMERLAQVALRETKGIPDRIAIHETRILALVAKNDLLGAIRLGLDVLGSFDIRFPDTPDQADISTAMQELDSEYQDAKIAELLQLPAMSDARQLAIVRLLVGISPVSYLASPALYVLLILKQVLLSMRHGNTAASSFAYASYGLILCASVSRIDAGYRFGRLALDLMQRLNDKRLFCKVPSIVASFVTHWKGHVRESLSPLRSAYMTGVEIGDFQFAAYSAILACAFPFITGTGNDLPGIRSEASAMLESVGRMKQTAVVQYFQILLQALHDAIEGRVSCALLQGEAYDERVMLPRHLQANDRHGPFYVHCCKLILSVVFGDHAQALEDSRNTEPYMDALAGMPYAPVYHLFDSLARMTAHRHEPRGALEEVLVRVDGNLSKLTVWARYAPMNCAHKCSLVNAERHRLLGEKTEALEAYDRAIAEARRDGYLREEALANELATGFLLDCGDEKTAAVRMRNAVRCYSLWGAAEKSARLERDYSALLAGDATAPSETPGRATTRLASTFQLDIATIVKASLAISREIDLERLAVQLLNIAIENAGAQHGALIMERDGEWTIQALGEADKREIDAANMHELLDGPAISAGIVSCVARTRASVVLDDASGAGEFMSDPYVARNRVKSILCMPLLNQSRISGILFLENNLVRGAFAPERLELLDMLSAQMALSLDNAQLYWRAQQELVERTHAEAALKESEQRFRTIFDSVNDAIFVQDIDSGAILDLNLTMCAMFGHTREEALRLQIGELSSGEPPYAQKDALEWMARAASEGPQNFEWRSKKKDGQLFWTEVNIRRAAINGQDRLLVVARDISERKRVEEALKASEAFLDSIIEHSPYSTWIGDGRGTLIRLNQRCRDVLHVTDEDVVGIYNPFEDPMVIDQGLVPLIGRVFEQKETVRFTMLYDSASIQHSGAKRPTDLILDITMSPVLDEQGKVVNIVTQHFDITEMKRAEENIRQLNEQLEQRVHERTAQLTEANKELESFSYSVSHDLRAPLRAIDGFTQLLVEGYGARLEAEGKRLCDVIQENSRRMGQLINDLLAFSRLGRVAMHHARIDMNEMTRTVLEECATPKERERLDMHVARLPPVSGDKALIRQVWVNLISNALKFSSKREKPLLEIGCAAGEGEYSYFVRDNGAGFDMHYANQLFGVFHRLHSSREFPGTGVGLAIVQRVIHRHGGRVWAEAEPDKGATFWFSLPRTDSPE